MPAYLVYTQGEEDQKKLGEVENLDRSQQEKVEVLQDLAHELGQEQGTVDPEVLKKEAEAEGISSDFVDAWLKDQGNEPPARPGGGG